MFDDVWRLKFCVCLLVRIEMFWFCCCLRLLGDVYCGNGWRYEFSWYKFVWFVNCNVSSVCVYVIGLEFWLNVVVVMV